jgi:hypothetical protein
MILSPGAIEGAIRLLDHCGRNGGSGNIVATELLKIGNVLMQSGKLVDQNIASWNRIRRCLTHMQAGRSAA